MWVLLRWSNPMGLMDPEGRSLIEVNDAAARLIGRSRDELVGFRPLELVPPEELKRADSQWEQMLRTGWASGLRVWKEPEVELEFVGRLALVGVRRVVIVVIMRVSPVARRLKRHSSSAALTKREREIVTLVALGHDTPAIAADLHVSLHTVRAHVRNAMSRLEVHTRAQLVAAALSSGQISYLPDIEP